MEFLRTLNPNPESTKEFGEKSQHMNLGSASIVAQLVKILPAMWAAWVRSLGWEDPLEVGKVTHPSIPAKGIPRTA